MILPTVLSIVFFCILVAEFWTGFAVVDFSGDDMLIDRRKSPGPYWLMMAIHTAGSVGLPLLSAFEP